MAGLAPFKVLLPAGAREIINATGSTIFLRRVLTNVPELGGVDANLAIELRAFVRETGESYTVQIAASEKLLTPAQYWQLEVENKNASAVWIELYLGVGDFFRPVPDIVNVAVSVPKANTITTYADNTNIDAAADVELLAANPSRVKALVTALSTNTSILRVGDDAVLAGRGTPLAPGETIAFEITAAIHAISEGNDDQGAALEEWVIS